MEEVKRYDSYGYDGMSGLMKEHADGDWVRSEDYDALRAENAELVAALEAALEETSYEDTGYQIATIIQAALAKHRGE